MKQTHIGLNTAITATALSISVLLTGCASHNDKPTTPETFSTENTSIPKIPDTGEVMDNGKGKYLHSTINDTDPSMKLNRELFTSDIKDLYTEEELHEAQKTVIRFIAEETIDSTVQGGGSVDQWFEKNKDRFTPEYQPEVQKALKDPNSAFLINSDIRSAAGYDLAYDEKSVRVEKRSIMLSNISKASGNRINVSADIKYKLKTNDGKTETGSGQISYIVTKSPDGKWLISGHKNKVSIQAHNLETAK